MCCSRQNKQKDKEKEKHVCCPKRWHASLAMAGKLNCVEQASTQFILRGVKGEETSVKGGNVERKRCCAAGAAADYRLWTTFAVNQADTRPIFFVSKYLGNNAALQKVLK